MWGNGNGPKRRRPISQAADAGMEGHTDRREKDDGGVESTPSMIT